MAMADFMLNAKVREELGKGPSHRLRTQGLVPAVVYSHGQTGINLSIPFGELSSMVHHAGLLTIKVGGQKQPITAIIKDYQLDPLRGHLTHADFQEVKVDEVISSTVSVHPHGTPAGALNGGFLDQSLHEIDIRCPANKMPESIEVDVSGLEVDDVMTAAELVLPEGVELETASDAAVFSVYIPRAEAEEEVEEGAEGVEGEPEVISKGKQDEEEGEQ